MNCNNYILSPGFIDLQINGCHGIDFSNPSLSQEDVIQVMEVLPMYGVTSFCPTIISSSRKLYRRNIDIIGNLCFQHQNDGQGGNNDDDDDSSDCDHGQNGEYNNNNKGGAKILGLHLEGPFFAKSKKGAHDAKFIQETINMSILSNTYSQKQLQEKNNNIIKIITMAPELNGSLSVIQSLTKEYNIVVSMGHTDATFEEGVDGVRNGATLITHLFNAMKPFHHREPGLLGLLQHTNDEESNSLTKQQQYQHEQNEKGNDSTSNTTRTSFSNPYFSIIVDGLHSHPAAVKMAYNLNPEKLILVTDAMSAMGLGDGIHSLGSMSVTIQNDTSKNKSKSSNNKRKATITGTDILAGSIVSMDTCIQNLVKFTSCSVKNAIKAATIHPARVLKMDKYIGSISVGSYADLVLLDDDLNVVKTFVNGRLVYDGVRKSSRKRKL